MDDRTPQGPSVLSLRLEAARAVGCTIACLDPETGYLWRIERGDTRRLVYGGLSPLNNALAAAIATDKFHAAAVLREAGFRVPRAERCLRPGRFAPGAFAPHTGFEAGHALAEDVGFPLIVKPAHGARGRSVTAVDDLAALRAAVEQVWQDDYLAVVETVAPGFDLRVDLLDGVCLIAYERHPVASLGDGGRALQDLVLNLNGPAAASLVDLPPGWLEHSQAVAGALGLRHCGIDFKREITAGDPARSMVIEVNASPGMEQIARRGYREVALAGEMRVIEAILGGGRD